MKQVMESEPNYPVPLHLRNAPTSMMKDLGYGEGYKYNPSFKEPIEQEYLPRQLQNRKFVGAAAALFQPKAA